MPDRFKINAAILHLADRLEREKGLVLRTENEVLKAGLLKIIPRKQKLITLLEKRMAKMDKGGA